MVGPLIDSLEVFLGGGTLTKSRLKLLKLAKFIMRSVPLGCAFTGFGASGLFWLNPQNTRYLYGILPRNLHTLPVLLLCWMFEVFLISAATYMFFFDFVWTLLFGTG